MKTIEKDAELKRKKHSKDQGQFGFILRINWIYNILLDIIISDFMK